MKQSYGSKINALVMAFSYFITSFVTHAKSITPLNNEQANKWKGTKAAISFILNTGDTHHHQLLSSFNLAYKVNNQLDLISNNTFQHANSKKKGLTAWQLIFLNQVNYTLNTKNYLYTLMQFKKDKFDGYDYRLQTSIGYGQKFDLSPNLVFSIQLGPGAEQLNEIKKKSEWLITANVKTSIDWKINQNTKITETITTIISKQHSLTSTNTSWSTMINDMFSLDVAIVLSYSSNPLKDKSHLNTNTHLSLLVHLN